MLSGLKSIWNPFTCEANFNGGIKLLNFLRTMSSQPINFVQQLNLVNNQMEWKVVDEDYDYNQEIATSCYGDMLHDVERNQKFGLALKKAIIKMHERGRKAHVLDIGTGTGLLSMLAVKYGADTVVACEAFQPMANCAVNIIDQNQYSKHIKVVKKHSTALTVGDNGDLLHRANILVSEVFDTELIGEGALKTFNHAHEHLLEKDCIVIPSSGTVYAQVVESDVAKKWNQLQDWKEGQDVIKIPDEIKNCPGAASVHDIQLSQFSQKSFKALTPVIPIFRFDWLASRKIPTHRQAQFPTTALTTGKAQVVFMWWDLIMDMDGEILLSCAPVWEHPDSKSSIEEESCEIGNPAKHIPWRDHWMQAVYFLTEENSFQTGDQITLISNHDEFSFWFKIKSGNASNYILNNGFTGKELETFRPVCKCTFHFLLSRTRIGAMNDNRRREIYYTSLKRVINRDSVCVVIGDMSLLPLMAAKMDAKRVLVLEDNSSLCKVLRTLSEFNHVDKKVVICPNIAQLCDEIRLMPSNLDNVVVVAEPYFQNSILPWDNISFWYVKNTLHAILDNLKQGDGNLNTIVCPKLGKIRGVPVQFDDLWKISTPLNTCEGFNMNIFDNLIESAKKKAESYMEAQPLWEYPGIALTDPVTFFTFDFTGQIPQSKIQVEGKFDFTWHSRCDGVALWMEYDLSDGCTLSSGPIEDITPKRYISWDMFERQGVHLFRNTPIVDEGNCLKYEVEFNPFSGEFGFNFIFESVK